MKRCRRVWTASDLTSDFPVNAFQYIENISLELRIIFQLYIYIYIYNLICALTSGFCNRSSELKTQNRLLNYICLLSVGVLSNTSFGIRKT